MMPGPLVHHLFEAQAAQTPDAPAVVWDGGTLSFRELDEQADLLANALTGHGIRPERLVGVSMDPSPKLLLTMLAVWKAGGVYVPVDPSLPRAVAETMLRHADVAAFVRNGPAALEPDGIPVLDLATLDLAAHTPTAPRPVIRPANLAYCVFTSGSTGMPKPVAVAHDSLVNHTLSLRDQLKLSPRDRSLQFTAMAFDAALEEIMPAWSAGAAVVMPAERRFTSHEFTGLIERLSVTMVSLPSAYWHQWVDDLTAGLVTLPPTLRIAFIGGDKIFVDKLTAWSQIPGADAVEWVSDYGPTETSISVALHRPDGSNTHSTVDGSDYALVPIGRPFADADIHILDPDLDPVPDTTPGDLWVGGPPVARGYYASPALTADRFLPDPFGPPGARMYRTGDRASRESDGTLVFLGRSDRQVKVRGQRVEPGQVESAVHRCTGVRDAVVLTVDTPPYGSRLVAYIEADPGVDETAIRTELTDRLPEFMVPHTLVLMDRIPRSPLNGKVARAQLPPVTPPTPAPAGPGNTTTTLEHVLGLLAGDVLETAPLDREQDFFTAGGDSLRAFRLLSRIAEVTGAALPFAAFRENPHPAGLAALVRRTRGHDTAHGPIPPRTERTDRLPAARGQQALWFLHQIHRAAPAYTIPLCYTLRGPLDTDRLDTALTTLTARHETLRTVFEADGGKIWQRIRPTTPVHTTLTETTGPTEAARLAEQEAARPFDLAAGPLLRSHLFRTGPDEHLWLLTIHHAVFDDWSLTVFWRELSALYTGRPLPEPTLQYADYCAWQDRWLRGPEAAKQRDHWRTHLTPAPALPAPGTPPPPGTPTTTDGFALPLPPHTLDPAAVTALAASRGTTVPVVLLAAFFATLRRTAGTDEAVIGVPAACRNRPGTEDLIGYLVNTLALRMPFTAGMSFGDLIARTDQALAHALSHQDLPYSDVVEALPRPPGGPTPLFHAMFAMQSTPHDSHHTLDGLDIGEHFLHTRTAKVPLTWTMRQSPDALDGEVEYAADHFDRNTARHWQDTLLHLLTAALADPDTPVDTLPLQEP
ncbi:amino acid adenylation domain-containing protein [Streptomyces sp. V2I9]|uniref:amino acid adenylation domain-containing protein n=1 Tax=Streptomyces sp. V2I9 TaxID=3042304 RepID=UPI002783AF84|nr:amino acid adenylation domain-containing protein [Streptomyces sp. V2I9]MDQ0988762.1 amino acid adenylation domain-containing protein [Streptomyces sp. V2I9]